MLRLVFYIYIFFLVNSMACNSSAHLRKKKMLLKCEYSERAGDQDLEPDGLRAAVGAELVARLRDDGTGGAEHGPPGMDQLVGLVPAGL